MTPIDSEVKRFKIKVKGLWWLKMISGLIWACVSLIIMKLARNLSYKSRMTPIDFRVKGQSYRTLVIENGFWTYCSLYFTFCRETCKIYFPWVNVYPYWFFGQKNKGQGQRRTLIIENGFWIMYACVSTWNMQVMFPIFKDHIKFMYNLSLCILTYNLVLQLGTLHLWCI